MGAPVVQSDLDDRAVDTLVQALRAVGLEAEASTGADRADLLATIDGRRFLIQVKAASVVDSGRAAGLGSPGRDAVTVGVGVVVADKVTAGARADLTEAGWGWFDRRGHLRLRAQGVLVDAQVPPAVGVGHPSEPIAGRGAMSVAYWLLDHPGHAISPTKQAADVGFSPATISRSVARLLDAGLVEEDGVASGPELFWALAEVWRPERAWLASVPLPQRDGAAGSTTARLTGSAAAAALGAPIVAASDATVELYVGGPVDLAIAQRRCGVAPPGVGPAAVAVAPVSAAVGSTAEDEAEGWTLAPLLAVALDLASDRGRGREVVSEWTAGDGIWR